MRYSIEPKDRINVKGYEFLPFTKNMGKNLSSEYGQKLLIMQKNQQQMQWKLLQKRTIQKTAEKTGDLIGNKIADEITSISKKIFNQVALRRAALTK